MLNMQAVRTPPAETAAEETEEGQSTLRLKTLVRDSR
jgi:hypothetical protein